MKHNYARDNSGCLMFGNSMLLSMGTSSVMNNIIRKKESRTLRLYILNMKNFNNRIKLHFYFIVEALKYKDNILDR